MPCGFESIWNCRGRMQRPGQRRPKPKAFKGSKAAKKASRRRR